MGTHQKRRTLPAALVTWLAAHPLALVYVAGPYSAGTEEGLVLNIANARAWGRAVARAGGVPVIPHSNTGGRSFERCQPYEWWIAATLKMQSRCDATLLIPLWDQSSGATKEMYAARALNQPTFEA